MPQLARKRGWKATAQLLIAALVVTLVPTAAHASEATPLTATATEQFTHTFDDVSLNNFSISKTAGTWPSNFSVSRITSNTARITGTPTAGEVGTYNFTVTAVQGGNSWTRSFSLTVSAAPVTDPDPDPNPSPSPSPSPDEEQPFASCGAGTASITTGALPNGQSGVAYSGRVDVDGFTAWGTAEANVQVSGLPTGLTATFAGTGSNRHVAVTGTPTQVGTFSLDVTVCTNREIASRTVSLVIEPGVVPTISPATIDAGWAGVAGTQTFTAAESVTSFTATSLATGLSFNSETGELSWGALAAGNYAFTLSATNVRGTTARDYTLTIKPAPVLTVDSVVSLLAGADLDLDAAASGDAVTFSVSGDDRFSIDSSTGEITAGAVPAGRYTITVTATNPAGSDSKTVTITAYTAPALGGSTTFSWSVGAGFAQSLSSTGNFVTYEVTEGSLPAGLTLNPSTGEITGTPTVAGTYAFRVTVTNWAGSASQSYAFTVNQPSAQTPKTTVAPGEALVVSGQGFLPGEQIELWVWSTPTYLKTINAGADGTFSTTVYLPVTIESGAHRIEARGALTGSQWIDITVVGGAAPAGAERGALATTGGQGVDGLWGAAVLLLILGALGAMVPARRQALN